MTNDILSIKDLTITAGSRAIVDGVSFKVPCGKIVAIAGGSGSGKTTIGLAVLRLLAPSLRIKEGKIVFEGRSLLEVPAREMQSFRGARIGMVFQDPLSVFDPLFTIGRQLDEVLAAHTGLSRQERYRKIMEALSEVELPDPRRVYQCYPHQLSGGMRQRAMIAQAIVCGPSLVIADEPTSSLDVTLQAKINEIFVRLRKRGIAMLLITHDLGMISRLADEVIVLYRGQAVEAGPAREVTGHPRHEYTRQLMEAFQ